MLTIRQSQMTALRAYMRASFEEQLVDFVQRAYPAYSPGSGSASAPELVRDGLAKAAAYGIDNERDIAKFVGLMAEFGSEFHKNPAAPWISGILTDPAIPAEAKVSLIEQQLRRK